VADADFDGVNDGADYRSGPTRRTRCPLNHWRRGRSDWC